MTREELREILPDISDEHLKKILDINSADIGKAKKDYTDLSTQLEDARTTIRQLNDAKGDYDDIKRQLGEYQTAEQQRRDAAVQAQKDAAVRTRFDKLSGERKYLNDFTKQGIFGEFKSAIEKEENVGKSDSDIFESIVKDREGIFASPYIPVNIPGVNPNIRQSSTDKMTDEEFYTQYYAKKK